MFKTEELPEYIQVALSNLTTKQSDFALYYVLGPERICGNGTQSAKAAGFAEASAAQQASELLRTPKVKEAVRLLTQFKQSGINITFQHYIQMLAQQANAWLDERGCPREVPLVSGGQLVTAEFVVRDAEGNIVYRKDRPDEPLTVMQPIIETLRPNAANVRAAELIGKALNYYDENPEKGRGLLPSNGKALPEGDGSKPPEHPTTGFDPKRLPDGAHQRFLESLPEFDDQEAVVVTDDK